MRTVWEWIRKQALVSIGLGLVGLAINYLPVEIFPGVHLIFGSTMAILAAAKWGMAAGGLAGLIAGWQTWALWPQPFPFSVCLCGLEGLWVGYMVKKGKSGPLVAALSFWVLLGMWLNLAVQLSFFSWPWRVALIIQARSIINGMLAGLLVELGLLVHQIAQRRRRSASPESSRLSLESLITILLVTMISLPMLYTSTRSARDVREKMLGDLVASSAKDAAAVESEISGLLQHYKRGVRMAAAMISAQKMRDRASLSQVLAAVRGEYREFAGMYVADAEARTIAFDPPYGPNGETLIGLSYVDRQYYRDVLATEATVYSGVYQARGGMLGPAVAIGEPLLDEDGRLTGFVLGWFDVKSFQRITARYNQEGGALVIADGAGQLIADSSLEWGAYKEVMSLADGQDWALVKERKSGSLYYTPATGHAVAQESKASLALPPLSDAFLLSFVTAPVTGWKVWSRQSLGVLKARLDKFYLDHVFVLIPVLLLAFALSKGAAHLLAKPLIELQRNAERLSAGNLSERPPEGWLITSEFESLFHSFRRMAESIESSWSRQQELLRAASMARRELEATFDAMTDTVVIMDNEDRLVRANQAFYQTVKIAPADALGRPITEIVHPDDNWQACEVCCHRRAGRHAIVLLKPEQNISRRYLEARVDPIYNAEGERWGTVQVIRDLTRIRQATAEAEKAGALLRNLVEAAYDAVYATDLDGRFLWANKRAGDLFGFAGAMPEGESFWRAVHPEDLARVRETFQSVVRSSQAQKYETRYLTRGGEVRYAMVTNSPVYAGGAIVAVLGIVRDLTEERLAAEQAIRSDKLRALGQLASGVAHNFNNSLTAILGYTQRLLRKTIDPRLAAQLKTVETAALDAAKMVQRIQNFARQQKDEEMAPAELNQIIHDALDLTRSRWRDDARAGGIAYDMVFRPLENVAVTCDQSALREVFVNLIINALDAMPAGGALTITVAREGEWALVTFADTGSGMTAEVRQRVFEPFFTTKGVKGYGMGLAVSYGIVERHGGDIRVTSAVGQGTTFTLRLPATQAEVASSETEVMPNARPASVLVVDDEAPVRTLIADLLRERGHTVLTAEDGLAGLNIIAEARFDLVISDLSMPGADGWTLVKEVRRRWPETKLMVVTGYGNLAEQAVAGGDASLVDALVAKPFKIAQIDATINQLLG